MRLARPVVFPLLALLLLPALARAAALTVVIPNHPPLTLDAKALGELPRGAARLAGKAYTGPTLNAVLRLAGAPSGPMLHGATMRDYVVVTGADGFAAVLSLAETDPEMRADAPILADRRDGAPLAQREGPWRLVIGGDRKKSRSVRMVSGIELRAAN